MIRPISIGRCTATSLLIILFTFNIHAQEVSSLINQRLSDWESETTAKPSEGVVTDSIEWAFTDAYIEGIVTDSIDIFDRRDYSNGLPRIKAGANLSILGNKVIDASRTLYTYQQNELSAIWFDENELSLLKADTMMRLLKQADAEGLLKEDYHFTTLAKYYKKINTDDLKMGLYDPDLVAKFDILLTDASIAYARHLRGGKVDPRLLEQMYEIDTDSIAVLSNIEKAIKENQLSSFFAKTASPHQQYQLLKKAYVEYEENLKNIEWERVPEGPKMELGVEEERVALLRKRLSEIPDSLNRPNYLNDDTLFYIIMDDGNVMESLTMRSDTFVLQTDSVYNAAYFDSTLYQLVYQFQKSKGLKADGIVGPQTLRALNTSPSDRLEQIKINLERWRWVPHDIGARHIIVNIPGFELRVYDEDTVSLVKRVVVGRPYTRTAVFNDYMRYIEFNPTWTVPYSISSRELLPKIKKNPAYLANNNMSLLSGGKKVNPYSVDWTNVSRSKFPYVIRQNPGAGNALGIVKFMFPNRYSIYVHDTQSKKLFSEKRRCFSHGCVRLENPLELAEFLLAGTKWDRPKIDQIISRGKKKRVDLEEPVPIYLLYFTAWVDEAGELQFYEDVYNKDGEVMELFFK